MRSTGSLSGVCPLPDDDWHTEPAKRTLQQKTGVFRAKGAVRIHRWLTIFGALGALLLIVVSWCGRGPRAWVNAGAGSLTQPVHREVSDQPPMASTNLNGTNATAAARGGATRWTRGPYVSVQVNVDHTGANIPGDAANEPSIDVDPTDPSRYVVGWRQFNSVASNFREGGWGYSHDGGYSWTNGGVLRRGEFSSDPVVRADADGTFYYYSLQPDRGPGSWACYLYTSYDAGLSWVDRGYAFGGDKAWIAIDRTGGVGRGYIYAAWSSAAQSCCGSADFTRSTDGGISFATPIDPAINPRWGTMAVGPDGTLYVVGADATSVFFARSSNAKLSNETPVFEFSRLVTLGGTSVLGGTPNPEGLLGTLWIRADHSNGPTRGTLYILGSVDPPGSDPLDVMLVRSTDRGSTWSAPVRVNDDPIGNGAWQWFGTMSVAPTGRIDVVFGDTRNDAAGQLSELFYASSTDGGQTFSANVPVSPSFDPMVGFPNQQKIGDYYDMVSDALGVGVAYAATFNGEQDVYFLRIGHADCNGNGVADDADIASGTSGDCQPNGVPDECEADCNSNGIADSCDIAAGTSIDCSGNRIPDECEPDCNGTGVEDLCDILLGTSSDCDANHIPDECEPDCDGDGLTDACDNDEDTDGDGLRDCDEACPTVAPPLPCICPAFGECCVVPGFCLQGYPRSDCIASGYTPTCQEAACCNGCLFGDADRDGDLDLRDIPDLQSCFSGAGASPTFAAPTGWCLDRFDADCDGDIDLTDFASFYVGFGL